MEIRFKINRLKKIFSCLAVLCSLNSNASDSSLIFRQLAYEQLFSTAREENRIIMLYFHYDGCGACLKMEKTAFRAPEVSDFYNEKLLNVEVNINKEKGAAINTIYQVKYFPTFIFLDPNGKELHRIVGVFSPEAFLDHARNTLAASKTLSAYQEQYRQGNRSAAFLYDYAYLLRDAYTLDSLVVNEYLQAISSDAYFQEKNLRFIYEFSVHRFNVYLPFRSTAFTFLLQNKASFYPFFDQDQVHTRIVWILSNALYEAIEQQDDSTFQETLQLLSEFDKSSPYLFKEMDGRITGMLRIQYLGITAQMAYYEKKQDRKGYDKALKEYLKQMWNDPDELNSYAWNSYEKANPDPDQIKTAIRCVQRAITLSNSYAAHDTYAWLLYKQGKMKKALAQAELAIQRAEETKLDAKETRRLVELIKKAPK